MIFLLLNNGKTQDEIANFLGCNVRKVVYWLIHGNSDNLESLVDERMKGNYQKATEEYVKSLPETIEKEPEELGYKFGKWTNARLSTYLQEKTRIKLSNSQIRNLLKKKKRAYKCDGISEIFRQKKICGICQKRKFRNIL